MRRRILLAILATVAVALVLSGIGTVALARNEAGTVDEQNLQGEAASIAALLANTNQPSLNPERQRQLVEGLDLRDLAVIVELPDGTIEGTVPGSTAAAGVDAADFVAGTDRSGQADGLTWAVASLPGTEGRTVSVVITRTTQPTRTPVGWFVLAGGLALGVGAVIAAWLSRTLTRPLQAAQAATVAIAEGDLDVRLPDPPGPEGDELADLTRSINTMAAGLAHSRGLERQFLMSVSHDLRTPLTSIRGYADAIADGTTDDPVAAGQIIGSEAQRLTRLVGDLLDLARLDAHEFSFERRLVPVAEVVTETAEGLRPVAEEAGVALLVTEPGDDFAAEVDPDRLAQAVANLVENGLKYALSTLSVETAAGTDGTVRVRVQDDGPGIAPSDVAHVFERLYVTDRAPRRHVGGTGLGLAIVRQLVEGMGGQVWAESPALTDGRGARLVISVPAATTAPGR